MTTTALALPTFDEAIARFDPVMGLEGRYEITIKAGELTTSTFNLKGD